MAYIKKLVMYGFKSFVRKTEIPFTPGINCVLGPNGSGKSNVSDGLCFVLGRLSAKSMRAAKASNLIFMGTKDVAPAKEASVEIIFDNTDNTFSLIEKEISIRRILRKNGQSIYKINNLIKTRQEVLGLLAQGGIDPNGFNIILQGEIQKINSEIIEKNKEIEQIRKIILTIETSVKSFESKIETINLTIQKSTGLEQERLNQDIANLRAELAGMIVKSENLERKLS